MKNRIIKIKNISAVLLITIFVLAISSCQKSDLTPSAFDDANTVQSKIAAPDVPAAIAVPDGYSVRTHVYAQGVQIYVSTLTVTGYAWIFQAPSATLYADAGYNGAIGTHYIGPTWASNSGSNVVGIKVTSAVSPDITSIPWLLLSAVSSGGPGIFNGVVYIQRVNTVGGIAPSTVADASNVGQEADVPYTAEYYFYQ